jgi:hypothetical protein
MVLLTHAFLPTVCTHTTCRYCLPSIIDVIIILFYYIGAPIINIILIVCISIPFQIDTVTFVAPIVNNTN